MALCGLHHSGSRAFHCTPTCITAIFVRCFSVGGESKKEARQVNPLAVPIVIILNVVRCSSVCGIEQIYCSSVSWSCKRRKRSCLWRAGQLYSSRTIWSELLCVWWFSRASFDAMVRSKEREIQVNFEQSCQIILVYLSTECVTISEYARSSPEAVQRPTDQRWSI